MMAAGSKVVSARPAERAETVRYVVSVAPSAVPAVEMAAGRGHVVDHSRRGDFVVLEAVPGSDAKAMLARVRRQGGVRLIRRSTRVRVATVPNDPRYANQWYLGTVAAPYAWELAGVAETVTVAVIDTGVDLDHPDLVASVDTARDRDFANSDNVADDDNGHGTHVAGIIGATRDNAEGIAGVTRGVKILPVKVLDASGSGWDSDLADGITHAVDNGARIINISAGTDGWDSASGTYVPPDVIGQAIRYAVDSGVLVMAASGNAYTSRPFYPAAFDGVFAVGATDAADGRAAFSNYADPAKGSHLDAVAPGVSITSTWRGGNYATMSGTSMATPVVSGLAAMILADSPLMTAAEVTERIKSSARDLGEPGADVYYGAGRVSAGDAFEEPSPDDAPPGVSSVTRAATGRVHPTMDLHDVYSVAVAPGMTLRASLRSTPAGVGMRLLPGDAISVGTAQVLASGGVSGQKVNLSYRSSASEDATYLIDVWAQAGGGAYELEWISGLPTALSIASSARTVPWGGSIDITGTLTSDAGEPLAGRSVMLDARTHGSDFPVSSGPSAMTTVTAADGTYAFRVTPLASSWFRVRFDDAPGMFGTVSESVNVWPVALATVPTRPSAPRAGRWFTSTVYVRPTRAVGSKAARVFWYHYENGGWRVRYISYAINRSNSGGRMRATTPVLLRYRGRWKSVAYVTTDFTRLGVIARSSAFTVR